VPSDKEAVEELAVVEGEAIMLELRLGQGQWEGCWLWKNN
jgi:hypothetical protein